MSPVTVSSSGIGVAHLPNQRHKIVTNKGTNFTIMVCGESGLGKSTFVNTLFTTTLKEPKDQNQRHQKQLDRTVEIEITTTGKGLAPSKKVYITIDINEAPSAYRN
jgi:cell division control protein 12